VVNNPQAAPANPLDAHARTSRRLLADGTGQGWDLGSTSTVRTPKPLPRMSWGAQTHEGQRGSRGRSRIKQPIACKD